MKKKEFIKYSKNFSNTLKAYFRDSKRDEVYTAANHLLIQTDYLLRTIKLYCETDTLDECLYPALNQRYQTKTTRHSGVNNQQRQTSASSNNRPGSSYDASFT